MDGALSMCEGHSWHPSGKKYFLGIIIYFLGITQIQEFDLRNCIYSHYSIVLDSLFFPTMAPSVDCWHDVAGRDCLCSAAGTYVIFIIDHKQNVLQQQSVSMLP
jgi:hypothetical protein